MRLSTKSYEKGEPNIQFQTSFHLKGVFTCLNWKEENLKVGHDMLLTIY